jgi:4-amino-4-deoxy-L-arabinose transferase-like glycosyltransferase
MASDRSESREWVVPVVLAVVALGLRLPGLDGGMWNDEIASIIQSFRTPFPENLAEFRGDNKHPLYAVLAHVCIVLFGESAWSIRIPALLFGVASVPMLYWLAKPFVGRREAIAAAVLLAVSYHHIWFSQSARGYSALLFFALLTTHQLLAMVRRGDRRAAWGFGLCIALGTYAHLTFVFFVVAQFALALFMWARPIAGSARPGWKSVLVPFVGGGILSAALHYPMLDPMLDYFLQASDMTGVSSPAWALGEALRVLRAGFGDNVGIALVALPLGGLVGLAGLVTWFRRDRDVALLMVLAPLAIIAGAAVGRGTMYPRFFFVLGGFFVLLVVRGAFAVGEWLASRFGPGRDAPPRVRDLGDRLGMAAVGVLVIASLASLPRNARVGKQDFDGPLAWIRRTAAPGDQVAVADVTAAVYLLYYQLPWTRIRTSADLDTMRRKGRVWFLYTFPRYLELYDRGLAEFVERECREQAVFPSTLGGGEVIVCSLEPLPPAAG